MAHGVTRDVEPSTLTDLLAGSPRATLAFVEGGAVNVLPVRAHCRRRTEPRERVSRVGLIAPRRDDPLNAGKLSGSWRFPRL